MSTVAIVVAEVGAEWLSWARQLRPRGESTLVLAQSPQEEDDAFARRVSERIERLERDGSVVEHAAFIAGERSDAAVRAERSAILRRLSSLLSLRGRAAQLYLDAASRTGRSSLQLMRALGFTIAELTRGSGLSVRLGAAGDLLALPAAH